MSGGLSIANAFSGLRRGVVDPVTGQPVITSAPTGEVVQRSSVLPIGRDDGGRLTPAVPGMIADAFSAAAYPGQVYRGEQSVMDPETGHVGDNAIAKAFGVAGSAMLGSAPVKVPRGALRSFGGAAAKDDPFAALEASLSNFVPEAPAPGPRRIDPNAKTWDVYHGSGAGPDFKRFDPAQASNPAERSGVFFAPDPETASAYAGAPSASGEAGSRVFRASVEPGKTKVFDLPHLAETDPSFNALAREITTRDSGAQFGGTFDRYLDDFLKNRAEHREFSAQAEAMGYPASPPDGISWGHGHLAAALERAKAEGLDTAILRGAIEHGGDDQVVAITPGRVRSHYDPSQILYSGGPAGAVAGAGAASVGDAFAPRKAKR